MKIAVITAVFGGIDKEKPFPEQVLPEGITYERFFINEDNTPVPLPNLPNRLKAKYFKTQSHNIPMFDGCGIHVWIDGNIEVTHSGFLNALCSTLFSDRIDNRSRVAIQSHHERATIGEEIEFILDSKNPYLVKRYGEQPLEDEHNHYLSKGMTSDATLYSCNVFARRDRYTDDFFDQWWRLCLEWSWFDQSAFSYLVSRTWKAVHTVDLGGVTTSPYYTLHGHDNWNQ